jgi:thiamine pyrophosphate-dependent acetolactate synthase large subunit-like protein
VPGLDLGAIDFAGLAAGYGLTYRSVDRPDLLALTLQEAFGLKGPSLVHVQIDPTVPPLIG